MDPAATMTATLRCEDIACHPDFVALAKAYGCHAERVTETAQFPAALARARAAGTAALIELVIDPQAITPTQTLEEIRAKALSSKG